MIDESPEFKCEFIKYDCADCPVIDSLHEDFHASLILFEMSRLGAENFLGDEFDEMVEQWADGDPQAAEQTKIALRQFAAQSLDNQEALMAEPKIIAEEMMSTCDRPLKMRAHKNGATFLVKICTSATAYMAGDPKEIPAEITRSTTED